MTQVRLTWLADELRAAGLHVVEVPGWETRSRPSTSGGFNPVGVLWHHTGSGDSRPDSTVDDVAYAKWLGVTGRSDLPPPLCQLSIGRNGWVYVVAAGRANHAGVAKASGSVSKGDGNELYVGVECQNSGSEGWTVAQYGSMVVVGAVLGHKLPCTVNAQRGHKETSVTGKWDPGALDMDEFRADINDEMTTRFAPKETPPVPNLNPVQRVRLNLTRAKRIIDTEVPPERVEVKNKSDRIQHMLDHMPEK